MNRTLPLMVALVLAATGCTALPTTTTKSGAPLTQSTAAKISAQSASRLAKKSMNSLKNAVASLKYLGNSSSKKAVGQKDTTIRTQALLRIQDDATSAAATDDESVPDNTYDQVKWYWTEIASQSQDNFYSQTVVEEGRLTTATGSVVVERYKSTSTFTTDASASTPDVERGTYTKKDEVLISQYRRLGTYAAAGTYADFSNGHNTTNATQTFTSPDGKTTAVATITSTYLNNVSTYRITGGLPNGGKIDMAYTNIDNTKQHQDASGSWVVDSGNYTATQKGSLTSADGSQSFLLDNSEVSTYVNGVWTNQATMNITVKDAIMLVFTETDDGRGNEAVTGSVYTTDVVKTKLGDITVDTNTYLGTVTYTDGSTDKLKLDPIFDLIYASKDK